MYVRLVFQPGVFFGEPFLDVFVHEAGAEAVFGEEVDDAVFEVAEQQVDVAADGVAGLAAEADEQVDRVRGGGDFLRRGPVHGFVQDAVTQVVVERFHAEKQVRGDFEEAARLFVILAIGPVGLGPEFIYTFGANEIADLLADVEREFLYRAAVDDHEAAEFASDAGKIFVGDFLDEILVGGVIVDEVAEAAPAPDAGQAAEENNFSRQFAAECGIPNQVRRIANQLHGGYSSTTRRCVAIVGNQCPI